MSLNNSNNKKQQQQQEPTYEISGTTTSPAPPTPLFPQIQQTQQQPQLSPLGRRNIVKVDPNLVRQAIREKAIIPTRQVTQKEAIKVTTIQEIINNYVLIHQWKDLKIYPSKSIIKSGNYHLRYMGCRRTAETRS